jgi:hypothetical protein
MTEEEKQIEEKRIADEAEAKRIADEAEEARIAGLTAEERIKEQIQKGIDEALKPIKSNLDNAYAARDAALNKAAKLEQEKRELELAKLKEEGKHKEAYELEVAALKASEAALKQKNTELTRDSDLRAALGSLVFKNERATQMAIAEITPQLIQNDQGVWIHKSGVTIGEYVTKFGKDENNSFLLKQKASSGANLDRTTGGAAASQKKSIFDYTQEEVIMMIAEGKDLH